MLEPLVTSKSTVLYTYLQSDINLDFLTNSANLTPYNARIDFKKGTVRRALLASEVLPYANLRGLFVLGPELMPSLIEVHAILKSTKSFSAPEYE